MNILGPLAAGVALTPVATKAIGHLAHKLSFAELFAAQDTAHEEASGSEMELAAAEQLGGLKKAITDRLIAGGFDVSEDITFGLTSQGQIEVRSAHLQTYEIEQALNRDPALVQQFVEAAAQVMAARGQGGSNAGQLDEFEIEVAF